MDPYHILSLPTDIQRQIFDLLPLQILISSQRVCKQWNNQLLSSLKKLTINDSRINGDTFSAIVSKLSPVQFKQVRLGAEAFIWDLSPLFRITRLSSLDIHNSPSLSSSAFVHAVSHLTWLKSIRISRSLITPRRALPAIVTHLPQLTELKISYTEDEVDGDDLLHVTKLTNLKTLSLDCTKTSLDDKFVLAVCSTLTKLESLQLEHTKVSESLSALHRLQNLTRLVIPEGYFLAKAASDLPLGMKHIEAQFSDKSVAALVPRCTRLTHLDIGVCPDPTKLTDAGFLYVVMGLLHLQTLNLRWEVTEEVFKATLKSLPPSVKYLGVAYNNALTIEVFDLKKTLPNVVHIAYTTEAAPNHEGDIQTLGEKLFPLVTSRVEEMGLGGHQFENKVTGMLLDGLDMVELNELMAHSEALNDRINEGLEVLGINTQEQHKITFNKEDEDDQNLREIILNATLKYLEEENEDLELAGKITDFIFGTEHLASLRADVKSAASLRKLIERTLLTKIRQKNIYRIHTINK